EFFRIFVWPTAIVWLAYLFRLELKNLIPRVQEVEALSARVTFDKMLSATENIIEKSSELEHPELTPSGIAEKLGPNSLSPRDEIRVAWLGLQAQLRRLMQVTPIDLNKITKSEVYNKHSAPLKMAIRLQLDGAIDQEN